MLAALPRPAYAEAGQAFSISPPLIELQADPGQTLNTTIKFTNISDGELVIKTQFNDFGPKNETGEPDIIFEDVENSKYSLRQWIASPAPFKIKAHETKSIDFPISIPKNAEPGGHYAVIRFTGTAPEQTGNGVSLTASIGTLVLLQVSGDIQEKAAIEEYFSAGVLETQKGFKVGDRSGFFKKGPLMFVERIENVGNVHLKPTGIIEVKNILGRTVETLRVNGNPTDKQDEPKSILPQSIRRFEQPLDKTWMFGRYTAKLTLVYGQGQQTLTATVTFWVIPFDLILAVLVIVVGLFFLLRWAIRRYNAHIIANATGGKHHTKRKR